MFSFVWTVLEDDNVAAAFRRQKWLCNVLVPSEVIVDWQLSGTDFFLHLCELLSAVTACDASLFVSVSCQLDSLCRCTVGVCCQLDSLCRCTVGVCRQLDSLCRCTVGVCRKPKYSSDSVVKYRLTKPSKNLTSVETVLLTETVQSTIPIESDAK